MSFLYSHPILLINTIVVLISGLIAFQQKRLTHNQFGKGKKFMSWCSHGGNWVDLFLMGLILDLIWPQRQLWNNKVIWVSFLASLLITLICHLVWSINQSMPGHIIKGEKSTLGLDLTIGGYYHFAYMLLALWLIICFFLKNLNHPSPVYLKVSVLLSVFTAIGIIQPTVYGNRFEDIKSERERKTMSALILTGVIWLIIWSPYFMTFTGKP